jgi:prolyl oligopeptidase
MTNSAAGHRWLVLLLLVFPFFVIALSSLVYFGGIRRTPLGQMGFSREKSPYPHTRREPVTETIFGTTVADPYRWLENGADPEVVRWTKEQDQLARAFLDTTPARAALVKRLKELFYVEDVSVPIRRCGKLFYTRRNPKQEKAVLYCYDEVEKKEKALVDLNAGANGANLSLGVWVPSRDGKFVAYTVSLNNADESTLFVMDVATGKNIEMDTITGAKYAYPSWLPDSSGFYYTWVPEVPAQKAADRPGMAQLRFHRLGTNPQEDVVVYPATGDPKKYLWAEVSHNGRWLVCWVGNHSDRNEIFYKDLKSRRAEWQPLVVNRPGNFYATAWRDHFYILTNENAPRYKLCRASAQNPAQWTEIIPQRPDAILRGPTICGGRLVVEWLQNVSSRLEVRELDGKLVREVALPEIGSVSAIGGEPDQATFFYLFSSYLRPYEIIECDTATGAEKKWFTQKIPIKPENYVTEQVWFTSRDGTRVPMFIVRGKYSRKDGRTPFILSGYGGFNISLKPVFSPVIYPWLEAGGGYAVANLRGGGELGEDWHRAGMGRNKQNTFDDFAAAAQFLADENYTRARRLAIRGGSNGGLLVAAMLAQRPDLFRAAVCAVPLADMVRYPHFGGAKLWLDEYGDPAREGDFRALYAYSPYHHIREGVEYPATLITTSSGDDRVDPLHARKLAAVLQAANRGPDPILLRTEVEAGHSGADKVEQWVENSADALSFIMNFLRVKPATEP